MNMKKKLGLLSLVAISAIAATQVDQINAEMTKLLTKYNTADSKAEVVFSKMAMNEKRATEIAGKAVYSKEVAGKKAAMEVTGSYDNQSGKKPTTTLEGKIKGNIDLLADQERAAELIDSLEKMGPDMIGNWKEKFGKALKASFKVEEKGTNDKGLTTSAKVTIEATINLKKLPNDMTEEDVLLTKVKVVAKVKTGSPASISLKGTLESNPKYKGFKEDEKGLKEWVEKMLAKDAETLQDIAEIIEDMDDMVTGALKGEDRD